MLEEFTESNLDCDMIGIKTNSQSTSIPETLKALTKNTHPHF